MEYENKILSKDEWTIQNIRDQFYIVEGEIEFQKQNPQFGDLKYYKKLREEMLFFMTTEQRQLVYTDWDCVPGDTVYQEVVSKVKHQEAQN
tara:strand:+ start:223 stop:495 length:273 start_codon:yes stop_codon:yes gene_type:complete